MRSLFRRLHLILLALRYGVHLIWSLGPEHHRLHWALTLVERMHVQGRTPAGLNRALPRLGPLAGVFAQALLEHPELADKTLHDALDAIAHLEIPLPPAETEHTLAAGYGRPLATLFRSIDLIPARNALAEQTHRAELLTPINGHTHVAIKLVRMAQVREIADDADLLCWLARWAERCSRRARGLKVRALAESFSRDILARFDLRAEAANLSQSGHHFDGDARIAVADVLWELCNDHILTMQHIETVAATDIPALHANHIKLAPLAAHIIELVTEQAFEHGFFHAALDAHRVRVSIEPDTLGRLVLADFAVMSSLSSQEREFFVHGATALFDQDYERLADLHRDHGHVDHTTRTEVLAAELRTRSEQHFAAEPHERTAGALFHHLLHAVQPFDGNVSPRLAAAQRSFEQAEMLAQALHPGANTWHLAKEALGRIAQRDIDHRGWIRRISEELPHLAHIVPRVPQLVVRYLQHQQHRGSVQYDAQLLRELAVELRRTRRLLWACGLALGAAVVFAGALQ
ncbi:ABC1 kinase family protein [Paraburkholderia phosphatilytica]|uniref:ABC1 kinase family protein n=1 Tax=Paraburkholderia phosphatilytica TaxID=2282883 RepID=UPI000E547FE2|nr:AarF/UbiB family protein [Paraburkholderia phosphatilytica]